MNKKVIYSGIFCLILMCGGNILQANAYEHWDYWWRQGDIEPLYYKDYSGYGEISNAISDWNSVDCAVDLSAGTGLQAQLWIHKVDLDDVSWAGLCVPTGTTGSYFDIVDVKLNDYFIGSWVSNKRRSTINHELGHALGLDHDNTYDAIENIPISVRYDVDGIYTPQQDDENGVKSIYGGD